MAKEIALIIIPIFLAGIGFIFSLKFLGSRFNFPLDLNFKYRKRRIFGENKTIRGPVIMGVLTMMFGVLLYTNISAQSYDLLTLCISYLLIGLLYSIGELPNSFIKRQLDINPGETSPDKKLKGIFNILDTLDSLIACGVGYLFIFKFNMLSVVTAVTIGYFLHLTTDRLMVQLRLKSLYK